jgi:hypothetical protein
MSISKFFESFRDFDRFANSSAVGSGSQDRIGPHIILCIVTQCFPYTVTVKKYDNFTVKAVKNNFL